VKTQPGWIVAGVLAVVAAIVIYGYVASSAPAGLVGNAAPSFAVKDLAGNSTSLGAYRGKVVVLNLWASWCPPCRAEMPDLENVYLAERDRGVVVLGVDQGESVLQAGRFARSLRVSYPILIDEEQQYGRVYRALGLPTTVIVNADGNVTQTFDGPVTAAQVLAAVAPLLAKS
jgi:peroxiredoxin